MQIAASPGLANAPLSNCALLVHILNQCWVRLLSVSMVLDALFQRNLGEFHCL